MKRAPVHLLHWERSIFLCICMIVLLLLPTQAGAEVINTVEYKVGDDAFTPTENLGTAIGEIEKDSTQITKPVTIKILGNQYSNGDWKMGAKTPGTLFYTDSVTLDGGGFTIGLGAKKQDALGRLLAITSSKEINVSSLTFSGGDLAVTWDKSATPPGTSGGGGLFVGVDDDGFGQDETENFTDLKMDRINFDKNSVTVNGIDGGGEGAGYAVGGGLSVQNIDKADNKSTAKLTNLNFTDNTAMFTSTDAPSDGNSQGGGARVRGVADLIMDNVLFKGNISSVKNGGHANGGGLAVNGTGTALGEVDNVTLGMRAKLSNLTFENNTVTISGTAKANNKEFGTVARGGGLLLFDNSAAATDVKSTVDVVDSVFTGNSALADGAKAKAQGGGAAVRAASLTKEGGDPVRALEATFQNSVFRDNKALGENEAEGYGGALYLAASQSGLTHKIIGTEITGNYASTAGGGVYADTGVQGFTLEISAVAGGPDTLIQGNTASADRHASGIVFSGANAATLNVEGDGNIWLWDPILVNLNDAATFEMYVTGASNFYWNGDNRFNANGSDITFEDSTINTGRYFSATVEKGTLGITFMNENTLNVDINRSENLAVFNYAQNTITGSGIDNSNGTLRIGVTDVDRQLMDKSGRILLVETANEADLDAFLDPGNPNGFNITDVKYDERLSGDPKGEPKQDGNRLYLDYGFKSDHQASIMRFKNAAAALPQLHEAVQREYGITDEQYAHIKSNWASVTPDYGVSQAQAGLAATGLVGDSARMRGTKPGRSTLQSASKVVASFEGDGLDMPTAAGPETTRSPYRANIWGGYIGNFSSTDSHGGHLGYDSDTHGGMVGFSVEFAEEFTLGLYSAYTDGNTDMKGVDSEVDTDGMHVGVVFGWTPLALPGLGLNADFTYSFYDNDGWRMVGGQKNKASFDQDVYSLGLGAEYAIALTENLFLTPFVNLRYSHLEQDSFTESGKVLATKVGSLDGDSFTTTPGLRLDAVFHFDGGTFSPYISAGWRHEWGDRDFDSRASYLNVPGEAWKVSSLETDRDSADVGVGFEVLKNLEDGKQIGFNFAYDGNFSGKSDSNNFYAGIVFNF